MKKALRQFAVTAPLTALMVVVVATAVGSQSTQVVTMSQLARQTHVHGLAVDREEPSFLFIATHHGLFRAGPDGTAVRVSPIHDFMGFGPHPTDPRTLYASGHPPAGGNLGFIASTDKGRTWTQLSPGVNGPVDFHQLTVSPADPKTIYGSYRGLQLSRDAGQTWTMVGPAPEKLIELAASARSPDTLYAATEGGLLVSTDAGKTWMPQLEVGPVTSVEVTPAGVIYAFVVGRGLVSATEGSLDFKTLSDGFAGAVLLHLASDANNPNRLFAVTARGRVLFSADEGRTWTTFGE